MAETRRADVGPGIRATPAGQRMTGAQDAVCVPRTHHVLAHNLRAARMIARASAPTHSTLVRGGGVAVLAAVAAMFAAAGARAGTYPMYQCGGASTAVAPGWSVYSFTTVASTVLSNTCANGGAIGDYVFSGGQPGAVTENGSSGSQVGLALNVPASAPDVTIKSITEIGRAHV